MSKPPTSVSTPLGLPARTWRQWLYQNRWPVSLLSLVAFCLLGFIYFQATYVSGVEINTRNFHLRSFSFRRDPFTNTQLTGVHHSPGPLHYRVWSELLYDSSIDPSIGALLKSPRSSTRWDLVYFDQAMSQGDASILVELLSLTDNQFGLYWPDWTVKNPKQAAVLWPVIQDLVSLQLYSLLPGIFEIALLDLPANEFQQRMYADVSQVLLETAKRRKMNGNPAEAMEIAKLGLNYGDNPELRTIANSTLAEIESF